MLVGPVRGEVAMGCSWLNESEVTKLQLFLFLRYRSVEEEAVHVARIGEVGSDLLPVFGCESNIAADVRDCTLPAWNKVYFRVV